MKHEDSHLSNDSHLSDEKLLSHIDAELSTQDEKLVRTHLETCWKCRVRRQEFADAITGFVRFHERESAARVPPADGPRALLKAQLRQASEAGNGGLWDWLVPRFGYASAVAAGGLLAILLIFGCPLLDRKVDRKTAPLALAAVFELPDATLTPGAAILADRRIVCAQEGANNKAVPAALQRKVFEEYRIGGADPRAYEVDYLVTPALGGADDIRNLWPHSYSATVWNARIKDALEDRLRHMVCEGDLDLSEAQKEIATNWIGAYKKYFQTDQPLAEHRDQPVP
jgi:hypothetical protein